MQLQLLSEPCAAFVNITKLKAWAKKEQMSESEI